MAMSVTNRRLDYYGLDRPRMGLRESGDAIVIRETESGLCACIIDVLGHGPEAHAIAVKSELFLRSAAEIDDPTALLTGLHAALKGTRGAAAGAAVLNAANGVLRYAGVGNTVIRRFGAVQDRLFSVDGIVGSMMRSPREQRMNLSPGDAVIMYTDGVQDRFELSDYPQLPGQDAQTIARTVIQRFGRDHDDAACIVVRYDP